MTKQIIMTPPTQFPRPTFNAIRQWCNLRNALIAEGVDVIVSPTPEPEMEHAVFTSNAGLLFKDVFVPSRFCPASSRQVEEPYWSAWLGPRYSTISVLDTFTRHSYSFEGAGDAMFSADRKHLWVGFRNGTSLGFKEVLDKAFDPVPDTVVRFIELESSFFWNLSTCFCPLDTGELIMYSGAFTDYARDTIEAWYDNKIIYVDDYDASLLACASISVGKTLITPEISVELRDELETKGYKVVEVDLSEFAAHGGPKCLTLEVIT